MRLRCDPGQLAHWHPLPGKQEQLIRRWQWNMDQIHQRSGQRDAKPRPWRFRNSYLLQSTVLSEVAEDESPGGQASNSLQILASQSGPPPLATEGPQKEASVSLQRTCLRGAPGPGSVSVGSEVGRGLENQTLESTTLLVTCCLCPGCTALGSLLTNTSPPSLTTPS